MIASADASELARQWYRTPVVGQAGRLLWSRYDARHDRFRLMSTRAGRTAAVPVRSSPVPFDVELGDTKRGGEVAVYSRCAGYSSPVAGYRKNAGCRLYQYAFRRRREERMALELPRGVVSAFLPTISHGQVAFAANLRDDTVAIYVQRGRDGWVRVPIKRPSGDDPLNGTRAEDAEGPTRLTLRDGKLAYAWEYSAQRPTCGADPYLGPALDSMIVVRDAGGRQRVVAHGNCPQDGGTFSVDQVQWIDAHVIRFLVGSAPGEIRRLDLDTGEVVSWTAPVFMDGYADDGLGHAIGHVGDIVMTMPVLPPAEPATP